MVSIIELGGTNTNRIRGKRVIFIDIIIS